MADPTGGLPPAAAANFTVTTTANDGPGSLRQAIADAVANAEDDTITLQANSTYSVCPALSVGDSGGRTIRIVGASDGTTVIRNSCTQSGGPTGSVILNGPGTTLDLQHLTIRDGKGNNGAVKNTGQLIVTDVLFERNNATGSGGGIWTDGPARISSSRFSDNSAGRDGGAIYAQGPNGSLEVNTSRMTDNRAGVDGGGSGGAIKGAFENPTVIVGSVIEGNSTAIDPSHTYEGSAVYGTEVTIIGSSIVRNRIRNSDGTAVQARRLTLRSTTVSQNTIGAPTTGRSAIDAVDELALVFSTVVDNQGREIFGGQLSSPVGAVSSFGSVVGGREGDNGADQCAPVFAARMTSYGYNVSDDPNCGLTDGPGDQGDVDDLGLLPLADNGGGGSSMHPSWSGPLIDGVAPIRACGEVGVFDQRGVPRPPPNEGGITNCDVGAIEFDPDRLPPHLLSDVPAWIEDAVRWIFFYEYANGYPDGTYRPNNSLTRAQFVNMLYGMDGSPDVSGYPPHGFTDVPPWVADAVRWAVRDPDGAGPLEPVMSGFGTTFQPNTTINRAQVTRALYRLAEAPNVSGYPPHGLTDVPAWIEDAVRWIVRDPDGGGPLAAIATGFPDSTYRPDDLTNRGQVTRMLFRFDQAGY